jgi:hypothetical protein
MQQDGTLRTNIYGNRANWLCLPESTADACAGDLTTTIVAADGRLLRETWKADATAPIDCFYVYPTVSTDPEETSDMIADPPEQNAVRQQFARFASKCKPFAPLYRQVTLAGLRKRAASGGDVIESLSRGTAYDDVRQAWDYYLEHDNKGRGVVLIGHSQGAMILTALIRNEIEGKPVQSRIVSAILLGTTIALPKGKDVGGTFKNMSLCHRSSQVGCVTTYAAFRSTAPPPANTLFGHVSTDGMTGACTNPAALAGGSGELRAHLSTEGQLLIGSARPIPWVIPERPISTPFVSVPGLLTARCATNDNATYLEVTVRGNPADPRTDEISGDFVGSAGVLANWGLHLIDANLAIGNLVDLVGQQAKAYGAGRR